MAGDIRDITDGAAPITMIIIHGDTADTGQDTAMDTGMDTMEAIIRIILTTIMGIIMDPTTVLSSTVTVIVHPGAATVTMQLPKQGVQRRERCMVRDTGRRAAAGSMHQTAGQLTPETIRCQEQGGETQ